MRNPSKILLPGRRDIALVVITVGRVKSDEI